MKRYFDIDFLRFLGLIGILISHSNCPEFLMQARSFDVPLMVFISAICSINSRSINDYGTYIKDRFIRLVIPAWLFLLLASTCVFPNVELSSVCFGKFIDNLFLLPRNHFWIIRVFFIMALITPFLLKLVSRYNLLVNVLILCALELINEYFSFNCHNYWGDGYAKASFVMILGYTIIAYTAILSTKFSNKQLLGISALFLLIVAFFMIKFELLISVFKYPPHFLYLMYGLGCSLLLYSIRNYYNVVARIPVVKDVIQFIGSHSIWIYIWHIPVVSVLKDSFCWEVRFLLILVVPLIVCFMQSCIVSFLTNKLPENISVYVKKVFIG